MEGKPLHYDGSLHPADMAGDGTGLNEQFVLTDEVRKNLGGNPYEINSAE